MARQDRTFTDVDVIRIWSKNLSIGEMNEVLCFFHAVIQARLQGSDSTILQVVQFFVNRIPTLDTILEIVTDAINSISREDALQCSEVFRRLRRTRVQA